VAAQADNTDKSNLVLRNSDARHKSILLLGRSRRMFRTVEILYTGAEPYEELLGSQPRDCRKTLHFVYPGKITSAFSARCAAAQMMHS
jgi:hypothetical protein